jgi:hypothetical protein
MASTGYMQGRQRFARPQGMLWSDTPGILSGGKYVPSGYEVGSDLTNISAQDAANSFLILTDHNRSDFSISPQRIEKRQRMINGTMRSHHIADKINLSTSWQMLPSRSYPIKPNFSQSTGNIDAGFIAREAAQRNASGLTYNTNTEYTADGGAGGGEMLDWYQNHKGPFWVFLAYDKYINFAEDDATRLLRLNQYNQIVQMYVSSFDYTVVKRGGSNHDLWNITVSLEEV